LDGDVMKLLQGSALRKQAEELGVNTSKTGTSKIDEFRSSAAEHEIQRRVMEAENHLRQDRLWVVALVSAIASMLSAAAAFVALFWHK
jgi:hypothetical protein